MQNSKAEVYLHMIWSTHERRAMISPAIERPLYRCIGQEVVRAGAVMLEVGGTQDHVHLVFRMPATVSIADFAKQVKGVSSRFATDALRQQAFRWQAGYAMYSVSPSRLQTIRDYVRSQKQHHAQATARDEWEA